MTHPDLARRRYDVVGIAASAGGVTAIGDLLATLPAEFPVPVVVVQHLDPNHRSMLAEIMDRRSRLHAVHAVDGVRVGPGTVYLAPPAHHLRVGIDGVLRTSTEDPVRFVRPAADLLFESLARAYGDRCIAVVLTGSGSDGAKGVVDVKNAGGLVVVQDPADSQFASMPRAAVDTGVADAVLPLADIGPRLVELLEPEHVDG